jgi:uroporphyrin-III C-methyltransferase/precorrin-2 dehydrogenase/sirohydrochlorin ferrochelatase/uroporphyrin-III C-methyltransferase
VYLVGAGPGDPELLTVKAARLIQDAESVVFDRLVSPAIQELIPPGATRIFVGKEPGRHPLRQEEINDLLIKLARSGQRVVRLKGGDPFIFGRGGEEAECLARHGVAFEVVPGITAASGCSAYAGIPLTHRDMANTIRLITGHGKENGEPDYDWKELIAADCTLVVYMGLGAIERIVASLIAAGMPPTTPAAAIENGATPAQRREIASVADLPQRVRDRGFAPPTLFVIGKVASLADQLTWFEPAAAGASVSTCVAA